MAGQGAQSGLMSRRGFMAALAALGSGAGLARAASGEDLIKFQIGLAARSFGALAGTRPTQFKVTDLPGATRELFSLSQLALDTGQFSSDAPEYLEAIRQAAAARRVSLPCLFISRAGELGSMLPANRDASMRNHVRWVEKAAVLGCTAVSVEWRGFSARILRDTREQEDFQRRSVESFRPLCDAAGEKGLSVLVESGLGPGAYPDPLLEFMEALQRPNAGVNLSLGLFARKVNPYDAVAALLPVTRQITANFVDFDDISGEETTLDYVQLLEIVYRRHGYQGGVFIDYRGRRLNPIEGIRAAQVLLLHCQDTGAPATAATTREGRP
jgi:sugar phosphate isomerase/epimerase